MTLWKTIPTFAALGLTGALLAAAGAHAERAGVAAAVNTQTQGKPPGGAARQIVLGQDVLHNEVIETDANGQAQILMLDRTALTIGPNSTLVIDRFIYDPSTKSGDMKLTLSRGLMRFTGGALSKDKPVNVRTPGATVGIRGGMGLIEVPSENEMNAGFLFGNEMTVSIGSSVAVRIERPGFATSVSGGEASAPRRWDSERVGALMRKLQGGAGRSGGLARQPAAGSTNQAVSDSLPAQDGEALNDAINQVLSNTEIIQNNDTGSVYSAANQTRPYNDLPPESPPSEEPPFKEPPIREPIDYCAVAGCGPLLPGGDTFVTPHLAKHFFVWLGSHHDIPNYDRSFTQAETVDWLTANQSKFTRFYTPEQIQDWVVNYATNGVGKQRPNERGPGRRGRGGVGNVEGAGAHSRHKGAGMGRRHAEGIVEQRQRGHGGRQNR